MRRLIWLIPLVFVAAPLLLAAVCVLWGRP